MEYTSGFERLKLLFEKYRSVFSETSVEFILKYILHIDTDVEKDELENIREQLIELISSIFDKHRAVVNEDTFCLIEIGDDCSYAYAAIFDNKGSSIVDLPNKFNFCSYYGILSEDHCNILHSEIDTLINKEELATDVFINELVELSWLIEVVVILKLVTMLKYEIRNIFLDYDLNNKYYIKGFEFVLEQHDDDEYLLFTT